MGRILPTATLLLLCGIAVASMRDVIGKTALGETVQPLNQLEASGLDKQLSSFESERERIKSLLLTSLGSGDPQVQYAAAYLLGFHRYSEAINDLAAVITLHNEETELNKRLPRWGEFPVVEALIRIGKPSVRAMLANLETSDDANVRGLSARVIFYVEGPDLSKIVVENAVNAQTDPDKKKRLQDALPLVKGGEYQIPKPR